MPTPEPSPREPAKRCRRCHEELPDHEAHYVPLGGPISGEPRTYLCIGCYQAQRRGYS